MNSVIHCNCKWPFTKKGDFQTPSPSALGNVRKQKVKWQNAYVWPSFSQKKYALRLGQGYSWFNCTEITNVDRFLSLSNYVDPPDRDKKILKLSRDAIRKTPWIQTCQQFVQILPSARNADRQHNNVCYLQYLKFK